MFVWLHDPIERSYSMHNSDFGLLIWVLRCYQERNSIQQQYSPLWATNLILVNYITHISWIISHTCIQCQNLHQNPFCIEGSFCPSDPLYLVFQSYRGAHCHWRILKGYVTCSIIFSLLCDVQHVWSCLSQYSVLFTCRQ